MTQGDDSNRASERTGAMRMFLLATWCCLLVGCATVPPEALQLSRGMGEDIVAIQVSYRQLIHVHFQDQRDRVNAFIDQRWKPAYLRSFITSGQLIQMASVQDPVEAFDGVSDWVDIAMEEISTKRDSLLLPISRQEDTLLTITDTAFSQLVRANAAITSHLASVRHVQQEQDRALEAVHLKSIRDRIDEGLSTVSGQTQKALDELDQDRKRLEAAVPKRRGQHH